MKIQMVDLASQYHKIKAEVDSAMQACIESTEFINGSAVKEFSKDLAVYNDVKHVIPCANGTDALQIALMALGLKEGDEVIVPAFTYVATAEVIALLKLKPVMIDVNPQTFMLDTAQIESKLTMCTKAIVPVHLFGQCADMEILLDFAKAHNLFVIEDTAQAIGADYKFKNGKVKKAGTMGDIGCISFFPSKNLGCFGDGGAIFTDSDELAEKMSMIANHGQKNKYYHDVVGVNSRLDTLQAAVLKVKLKYLDQYKEARNEAAVYYDEHLSELADISIPHRVTYSSHVFHQYTIKVKNSKRDELKEYLHLKGIPSMIYYPLPLHLQRAYNSPTYGVGSFPVAEDLCKEVLSLPMHTELTAGELNYIVQQVRYFFNN